MGGRLVVGEMGDGLSLEQSEHTQHLATVFGLFDEQSVAARNN